jgi:hypothetical protein
MKTVLVFLTSIDDDDDDDDDVIVDRNIIFSLSTQQ